MSDGPACCPAKSVGSGSPLWLPRLAIARRRLGPEPCARCRPEGGREPDDPVTARGVDQHRVAPGWGVRQPRPVPGQRNRAAGRAPVRGLVHGHRGTAWPDREDRRPAAGQLGQDVGNHPAARSDRQRPKAGLGHPARLSEPVSALTTHVVFESGESDADQGSAKLVGE
jgi:hypothetical protein